ncbi:Glycosyltransferase-like protein [Halorubrum aidingense JCM 13560]|uniref:Glycosyltransferase-like protein n=1 Tax=Halorubrum aidingense JCM 13560 TaxID=1230454 RepID=M0PP50_9EURY|nr:glycosyltransferase family 4 protein [Halorubrum aidingense]EMA70645.1 Glycosyltransferase-like protein [Halorubrum aidingense JCM 13560]
MRVLNLVTNDQSRFFQQQVEGLEAVGVECTTVAVPGYRDYDGDNVDGRGPIDYLRLLPPTLRRSFGEYDLIHANFGLTAPAAVLQPNLPVVVSLWGTDLMGKYGWVSKIFAARADEVVVMSDEMADEFGRPCHVIPHGVNLDRFAPQSTAEARRDLGWDEGVHQVLFPYPPGRGVKNYPRAARVVEAASEALDGEVRLQTVSGVPHERMPTYMNAADALLLTSEREGSPNSVKEAMACNLPVVSTDVGDVRERLSGVSPSAVCTTDDGLTDALVDVLERETRSNGRDVVREVSVTRTRDRLHAVYQQVCGE